MKKRTLLTVWVLCGFATAALAADSATMKTARDAFAKYQDAVIGISGVLKIQYPGSDEREQKIESLGTIIDPSGLTVVSLATVDPLSMAPKRYQDQVKSKLSDVKIRLADNTEIPAKLVLKDPDLDLGFLMPVKEDDKELPKFTTVKLDTGAKAEILDDVVVLSRLPKSLNRTPAVNLGYVNAILKKPRLLYCFETIGDVGVGIPAFLKDGKTLGICLMRKTASADGNDGSTIILPSEDVMEIAEQELSKHKKKEK